jgi:hypothetical protein
MLYAAHFFDKSRLKLGLAKVIAFAPFVLPQKKELVYLSGKTNGVKHKWKSKTPMKNPAQHPDGLDGKQTRGSRDRNLFRTGNLVGGT